MSDPYWKICIEEGLSECGIAATDEQVDQLVKIVEGGFENHGLGTGRDCIPHPATTELREEERRRAKDAKAAQERERILCESIASRYNIPVWVSIRDGRVEVEAQR